MTLKRPGLERALHVPGGVTHERIPCNRNGSVNRWTEMMLAENETSTDTICVLGVNASTYIAEAVGRKRR
jgi:hypothetical protein